MNSLRCLEGGSCYLSVTSLPNLDTGNAGHYALLLFIHLIVSFAWLAREGLFLPGITITSANAGCIYALQRGSGRQTIMRRCSTEACT